MKTLIAVPCMDQVAAPFAQNLAAMQKDGESLVSFIIGSLIYESRNNFAKQALAVKADYVLWLDSDMIFPGDLMPRMHKHMQEGKDIVTGLYFRRRPPFTPVLYKELGVNEDGSGFHSDYNDYPKDSLFEVGGCGFGCVMTRTSVLEDIALNQHQWFEPYHSFGEDLSFCLRARELGHRIWCDSTIKCGHVGQLIVDESVYLSTVSG